MRHVALLFLALFAVACSSRPVPPLWIPEAGVPMKGDPRREVTSESVVFLGDSLTHIGWWKGWFPSVKTANQGWGGDTTFHVLARLDEVLEKNPKKIFLLIGGNNILGNYDLALTILSYQKIIQRITTECPDTKLYALTVFPMGEHLRWYHEDVSKRYREDIRALSEGIVLVCVQYKVPVLTVGEHVMSDSKGYLKKEYHCGDEVHLSWPGYQGWISAIKKKVEEP